MQRYSLPIRLMHWLMAIMIITIASVGIWMASLPNDYPGKYDFYALHKSFGLLILLLVIMRLVTRLLSKIPSYEDVKIKKWEITAAKLAHGALYFFMFMMPVSGYLMSSLSGRAVMLFSIEMPAITCFSAEVASKLASNAYFFHTVIVWGMIALIVLHIIGSLKHVLIDKQNILKRIWF